MKRIRKNRVKLNSGQLIGLILISFFVGIIIYFFFNYKNLKERGKFTNGIAERWKQPGGPGKGGTHNVYYSFSVEGKRFSGYVGYGTDLLPADVWTREFMGRPITVFYDSLNPKNNDALIVPLDFRRYGLPCPDSLKWVTDPRYKLTGPPRKN
jgi:hypothetical protein